MYRSFSNRMLAGVCGGIASSLPLNPWIWRGIFLVMTLATLGAGALIYLLMWWILPLDSPLQRRAGGSLPGLLSILLGGLVLGVWFGRGALNLPLNVYWGLAGVLLALVFLIKQLFTGRGHNIALGLVALTVPTVYLLNHYALLQAGILDILMRSAPAVLVFLGLYWLLRYRVRFGSWVALALSIMLIMSLMTYAYTSRVNVISTDNQFTVTIPNADDHGQTVIGENITTLGVTLSTLETDITLTVSDSARQIETRFVGSNNSQIVIDYSEDENTLGEVQIIERQRSDFPMLQDVGRGELTVLLPANLAVGVTLSSTGANLITLDMGELNLERLSFRVDQGDVLVRLPDYQPRSPSVIESNGRWQMQSGNLRVLTPPNLGLRLFFDRERNAEPGNFDNLIFALGLEPADYVLASRQYDNLDAQMQYRVDINGRFSLEVADE
ncbi:MAG: PspC domain-containing protein [Anaerolineae bacterium]